MHLSDELLSAYLDGELTLTEATAATAHLRACAGCAETARLYAALDERLTSIPALACASALTLVSAQLDGELDGEESAIAATHLAGCAVCRATVLRWSVADQALAALPPARPSARVDAAIAALGRQPEGRRLPRVAWPVPALAVAAALSILIVFNLSVGPAGPVGPSTALVAAIQQSVLNPATGILYVLHPENGTVAAFDAQTGEPRSVITVGGRPSALALNAATNTIIVFDATAKIVTEIDGARNTVTSSTAVAIPGTPTSVQVDPKGNLVFTAVSAASGASSAPRSGGPGGVVAVFNGETKQLESVKQVDIAPQSAVLEPNGKRALLVSPAATTLVDATTYQPLAAASPGGVAAAFAASGDDFAILSSGPNGASVSFARRTGSLVVGGTPHAIAALPDGGFAVLADLNDRGVITLIAPDGTIIATLDAPAKARDLAYDAAARQFAVIGGASVVPVSLPAALLHAPTGPVTPISSGTALPTARTSTPPSATPTPTPAPTEPVAVVAPSQSNGLAPRNGRLVWAGTYLVTVPTGQRPDRAVGDGAHIWYLDDFNRLSALNLTTGERFQIASLPANANVGRMLLSPNHVYLIDSLAGVVYALTIATEQLATVPMPFATTALSAVASADERLWIGTAGAGLIGYDPRTGRIETIAAGPNLTALASDSLGRIWIAARERQAIDLYDPLTGTLTDITLAHGGAISALAVDKSGTLWIGTDGGQAFAMRNNSVTSSRALGRPISDFVLDQNGAAIFVSEQLSGIAYGSAAGFGIDRQAPVGSSGPIFDQLGRVWQADRSADGFYVTLPDGSR